MIKFEKFLWTVFLAAFISRSIFGAAPSFLLSIIVSSGAFLSILYFFFTFALLNNIELNDIKDGIDTQKNHLVRFFGAIGLGFFYFFFVAAIALTSLRFPGTSVLLWGSSLVIFVSLLISLNKRKSGEAIYFYTSVIKRNCFILILSFIFIALTFVPKETRNRILPYPTRTVKQ